MEKQLLKHLHLLPIKGVLKDLNRGSFQIKIGHEYYYIPEKKVELSMSLSKDSVAWVYICQGQTQVILLDYMAMPHSCIPNININLEDL